MGLPPEGVWRRLRVPELRALFSRAALRCQAMGGYPGGLRREVRGADLETSRRVRPVAQQGGVVHLGTPVERHGDRSEAGSTRRTERRGARQGSAHGHLLLALRVV